MKTGSNATIPRISRAPLLALVLSLIGIAFVPDANAADGWSIKIGSFNAVKGSGVIKSESRNVSGFQAVTLRGSMKVVLRQGAHEGVQISGDDNIIPLVDASVVDRNGVPTLELGMKKGTNVMTSGDITATVDVTNLSALTISGSGELSGDALKSQVLVLTISGSGEVRLMKLAVDDLSVRISGSGEVEFGGHAGKLGVTISGSGDFDSSALDADDVNIRVAGSGAAKINAKKTLDVSISGAGDVTYTGDPVVKSKIGGHGSITKQ